MSFLPRSLAARLLLLFLATAAALGLIISATLGLATSHQFRAVIRPHIVQYLDYIRRDLGRPPDLERARALTRRVPVELYIRGPGVNWSSTGRPPELAGVEFRRRRGPHGEQVALAERGDRFLLRADSGPWQLYFDVRRRAGHHHGYWIGLLALAAMLLVIWLCYRGIRRLFRPVTDIQQGVARFAAGELDYRIPARHSDELGTLVVSINAMAADIRGMLDAKRQLLLALSHELRSPLTRARVSLALLDDTATRDELGRDLAEMQHLIDELLEAERLEGRHAALHREPVALDGLLREVIEEYFPGRGITLDPDLPCDWVALDAARIRLLLKNLLDNALRHTPADRPAPRLGAELGEQALVLKVIDHGEGVAAGHLPHLTEPFYRADPARDRDTGGSGLGLYLCRLIAAAHGGRLEIDSRPGQGTEVRVLLPPAAA